MIVGISGKFFSGKDTFYDILQEHTVQEYWENVKFADKLKQMTAILTGDKDQYSQEGKKHTVEAFGLTNGRLQQLMGEGLRQTLDPLVWAKALFAEYDHKSNWILTDLRYKNEAEYIKSLPVESVLIRVEAKYPTWQELVDQSGRDVTHKSEVDLDDYEHFDYFIDNDSSVTEYKDKCENLIRMLGL